MLYKLLIESLLNKRVAKHNQTLKSFNISLKPNIRNKLKSTVIKVIYTIILALTTKKSHILYKTVNDFNIFLYLIF